MEDQELHYSPTSPADAPEDVAAPGSAVVSQQDLNDDIEPPDYVPTDPVLTEQVQTEIIPPDMASVPLPPGAVPVCLVGSKLDKQLKLVANRWIKVGRHAQSQLLINEEGISAEHCRLRWDPSHRKIEIEDTSTRGTYVNGESMKSRRGAAPRRVLEHADRISITAVSGKKFLIVLDLRPVRLGYSDPTIQVAKKRTRKTVHERLEEARAKDKKRKEIEQRLEDECFAKEREYFQLLAERQTIKSEIEANIVQKEQMDKETEKLGHELVASRANWLVKLRAKQEKDEEDVRPLREKTAETQVQLERLKLKKDELETSLYPERYNMKAQAQVDEVPGLPAASDKAISEQGEAPDAGIYNEEDEEQALTDIPAKGKDSAQSEAAAPAIEEKQPGDGDEPPSKRQKTGQGEEDDDLFGDPDS